MNKQRITIGGAILIVLLVIIGGAIYHQHRQSKYVQSTTPTLFFHGGGSNYHAEEHMVNVARKAGVTKTVIRANVTNSGKVTLHGTMHRGAINPIVEVNYDT